MLQGCSKNEQCLPPCKQQAPWRILMISSSERDHQHIYGIAWLQGEWVLGWANAWVDWKHLPKPRGLPDHRQHLPPAVAGCHPFSIFCLLGSHEKPVRDKTDRCETGYCSFSWCELPEEESACLSSHISFCVSHSHLSASLTS